MMRRQRGAGLLVAVLLIVTVAAFAVIVAASQSGGDVRANDMHADSVQALYLAETGVERALKRFATGTACTALGDDPATGPVEPTHTITDLTSISLTGASITFVNGVSTDFVGTALAATQCRVRVTGTVTTSNVSRTLHAIVDRNLLEGPDNPSFNNPRAAGAPSGWTLSPGGSFAITGGPDGASPSCSRSGWQVKESLGGGPNIRRASGTTAVQFALTAGSTTNITFNRRAVQRAAACAGAPGNGPAALPAGCGADTLGTKVCFEMTGTGGGPWYASSDAGTVGPIAGAACPSTYNPCNTNYQAGYPTKVNLNVVMAGATSVTQFAYFLLLSNVNGNTMKEIFVDDIEATNPTAVGAAHVRVWRDCSTAADPVNCV